MPRKTFWSRIRPPPSSGFNEAAARCRGKHLLRDQAERLGPALQ